MKNIAKIIMILIALIILSSTVVHAESFQLPIPKVGIEVGEAETPEDYVDSIKILMLLTVLTLVPSILVLMTSFTRIVIVLSFTRSAMGTQQVPPNQVLVGLAIILTIFIMQPVYTEVVSNAIDPYLAGAITQEEAIEIGSEPIKKFMLKQTREKDLALFYKISKEDLPNDRMETSFSVLVPAFVISELKTAFQMGFMIFMPFIVIDLIVASILMSMGMFMLPPVMIALPFKLLLFVMVDGWHLMVKSLVESFV